ncbi:RNA polymerase subunit sigma-24 [Nakamurella sp. DB0629]|uniref:RNA polymerase subunit sigma-24 n=1 Tax=Nakamurella aerolata TaxID=1656892 RepID=A0A849A7H9_9ACTN|nr:RNA polymerase subunit sigma-24 [Nakamurella aerolata]
MLAAVVRQEWGRLTSLLLAHFRRLDLVEDALADAVETATTRWPRDGVPDNPAGWLHTAARRRVLDRLRAEMMAQRKMPLLLIDAEHRSTATTFADPDDQVEDDLLRLVLMCTHPALDPAAASALTLRLVLGVSTADIARLFLVPEPTMAARLTRAKKKIVTAGIPFAVPSADALPERLQVLAQTAYLAFTAGYAPGSGPDVVRTALAAEAIRLVRVVLELRRGEPVLVALLALMLLQHSRRDARVDDAGAVVLLPDQDRSRWRQDEVAEGVALLSSPALTGPIPVLAAGYAVQARIAAEHATAASAEATDWSRVVRHYDDLLVLAPTPSARLARAVAVAEADGPLAGLDAMAGLDDALPRSHRLPAVRAALLERAGERDAARAAYGLALQRCGNDAEAADLRRRRDALG